MTHYSGTVIEAQADWLTCSAHGDETSERLEDYARHLLEVEVSKGNHRAPWHSMGYAGQHSGQIDWGRRDGHSVIFRASGQSATDVLDEALSLADHVTRLDLALTWRAEPVDPLLGANAYSLAELFFREHPRAAVPSQKRDALGGCTTYLGDRRSPYYARIYNKEAERLSRQDERTAEHYRACWRYEVEAHDDRAMALATALADHDERSPWIQQWLYEWFTKRGVPPAFPETGADALVPGFHRRTDDETRLRHLARNVAPTVARLRANGQHDRTLRALGLAPEEELLRELQGLTSLPWPTMGRSGPRVTRQGGEPNGQDQVRGVHELRADAPAPDVSPEGH